MKKLHLGCGYHFFKGWDNIDNLPRVPNVIKHDLLEGLPYEDNSVDFIYTEHVLEHFNEKDGFYILKECNRVLKNEGVLRISVPNLRINIEDYVSSKMDRYSSIGLNYRNRCHQFNELTRNWGHLYMYDDEELEFKLKSSNFKKVYSVKYKESSYSELKNLEKRPDLEELILEAIK